MFIIQRDKLEENFSQEHLSHCKYFTRNQINTINSNIAKYNNEINKSKSTLIDTQKFYANLWIDRYPLSRISVHDHLGVKSNFTYVSKIEFCINEYGSINKFFFFS